MSAGAGDREDRALEALIASTYCREDGVEEQMDPTTLPPLSDEKERAIDSLGADFVQQLINGRLDRPELTDPPEPCYGEELALAGEGIGFGLDRAEEIDEETTQELDEQRRALRERKRKEQSNGEATGT
jgi:hypothetical protein